MIRTDKAGDRGQRVGRSYGVDSFYHNPALYYLFKYSVASMISSLSRLRFGEIVSFVSLGIRSVSELIVGIERISNAI